MRRNLSKEGFILRYCLRGYILSWWARQVGIKGSTSHIVSAVKKQSVDRKWGWAMRPQHSFPVTRFFQQGLPSLGSIIFPNSVPKWGQGFQTHEPMGDILHSDIHILQGYWIGLGAPRHL